MSFLTLIILHNNLIPHFFQVFLQHLYVPDLFIDIVSLNQDYIGEFIIENPYQRVQFVFINLVMQPFANESLPIRQRDLKDKDIVVLPHREYISPTGACVDFRHFF